MRDDDVNGRGFIAAIEVRNSRRDVPRSVAFSQGSPTSLIDRDLNR